MDLATQFYGSTDIELSTIYSNLGTANFRDITSGIAGGYRATAGWDFVTGVSSNQGVAGK